MKVKLTLTPQSCQAFVDDRVDNKVVSYGCCYIAAAKYVDENTEKEVNIDYCDVIHQVVLQKIKALFNNSDNVMRDVTWKKCNDTAFVWFNVSSDAAQTFREISEANYTESRELEFVFQCGNTFDKCMRHITVDNRNEAAKEFCDWFAVGA